MKGLSLRQPWASLVAIRAKLVETRSWSTTYRGPVLICSSKAKMLLEDLELARSSPFREALEGAGLTPETLPLGQALAVVDLVDVKPTTSPAVRMSLTAREHAFGNYEAGRFAFLLAKVRPLRPPVPIRGALGLWALPVALETVIREHAKPAKW